MDLIQKNAPMGFHFGFEPLPDFYENLVVKYAQNRQIKIFDIALADQTAVTSYNYVVSNPAYSGLIKRTYDRPSEVDAQIRVKTDLLDNCIDKNIKIDLIKIDVEGGEYQVLLGAKELIKKSKPVIIFEHGKGASDAYGTTPSLIFAYFEDLNYKIYTMSAWLKSQNSFTKEEFVNEYENNRNYYFLAAI
jgi:FkbM family methyltransferase